jgi:putative ABC transport system permease protein
MIRFLIKGLLRDKSRSRLPIIVVAIGVWLTVFMHAYVTGFMGDSIELNAKFTTGHLKVMTRAYAENMSQVPNDMALVGVEELFGQLNTDFPEVEWTPRIQFGGLVDVPDEQGETRSQGPAMGMALDLLSGNNKEVERLNLEKAKVQGNLINKPGEVLLSDLFAQKLKVKPGDEITLIGSTMNGSMSFYNFKVVGTVSFGSEVLDRGTIIVDIEDARLALDMEDATGEMLGFLKSGFYNNDEANMIATKFNLSKIDENDDFAPVMQSLAQQGSMGQYVAIADVWTLYISMIFVIAMALVLWNAGLLGGLRRYGEFGVRLAMGEEKSHVYRTLIYEAIVIGTIGTIVGTALGLLSGWLLQTYGIDISGMMEGSSIMMPSEIRARITPTDYYIGFIPGLFATIIGSALAGVGIYKRKTSQLFKELEA